VAGELWLQHAVGRIGFAQLTLPVLCQGSPHVFALQPYSDLASLVQVDKDISPVQIA